MIRVMSAIGGLFYFYRNKMAALISSELLERELSLGAYKIEDLDDFLS